MEKTDISGETVNAIEGFRKRLVIAIHKIQQDRKDINNTVY